MLLKVVLIGEFTVNSGCRDNTYNDTSLSSIRTDSCSFWLLMQNKYFCEEQMDSNEEVSNSRLEGEKEAIQMIDIILN